MNRLLVLLGLSMLLACQHHKPQPTSPAPAAVAPSAALPIGVAACDDYLRRVATCQKLSPAARDAFTRSAGAWKAAGASSAKICEDVVKSADVALAELGC
jgi:hypothetical protein